MSDEKTPPSVQYVYVADLRAHPVNDRIYGETVPDTDLVASVKAHGVMEPLVVKPDGVIISGHRRWQAATQAGIEEVPVRYADFANDLDERATIIEYNRQREKTFSQRMAEAEELRVIEAERQERARREKISTYRATGETVETLPPSKTRDKVAKQVGIGSGRTYDKAAKVWQAAKRGDETAQELVQKLDGGDITVNKAYTTYTKAETYGHGESGDEWYTPKWLFDSLGLQFDIDVCGPADRTHVATPAHAFYTEQDNGLAQPWRGLIWCNPPYSDATPWAAKMIEHGNGLLLTHIPMNAGWCADVWQACDGIRLFQAMVFVRPDGTEQRPGYWLQLAAFGEQAANALSRMVVPPHVAENPRRVPSPMWRADK